MATYQIDWRHILVKIADLASYIENNFDGLYSSISLKDRVEAKRMLVSSSGAMEKNIDELSVVGLRNMV